jgi:hypothetical protein
VLRTWRERLTLALLALLPFHALGVTVLTRLVAGPDQPPRGVLALWKEALLAVILLLACAECVTASRKPGAGSPWRFDLLDLCIAVLTLALLVSSLLVSGLGSPSFVYGIRYDLVPLAAFTVLRRVPWSDRFLARLPYVLAGAVLAAVVYGLATLALPEPFFRALGYGDLHSLYVPGRPVAAFQQVGGTALRRMQGPMSGPNQFGMWLAMVLPIVYALPARRRRLLAPLLLLGVVLTFSRAAWIAAAVVTIAAAWPRLKTLSVAAVTASCIGVLAASAAVLLLFPSVVLRVESSADHLRNPLAAVAIMLREPLGRGLGSAGPANNRVADACVYLEEGSDAAWAAPHQDLCVFVGGEKVQPAGRDCTCPLLPENWYLQLGVEGGWIAMLAFVALVVVLIRRLWPTPPASGLLAVAVAGLFLHAWEDAAVAYTSWILCAIALTIVSSSAREATPSSPRASGG